MKFAGAGLVKPDPRRSLPYVTKGRCFSSLPSGGKFALRNACSPPMVTKSITQGRFTTTRLSVSQIFQAHAIGGPSAAINRHSNTKPSRSTLCAFQSGSFLPPGFSCFLCVFFFLVIMKSMQKKHFMDEDHH